MVDGFQLQTAVDPNISLVYVTYEAMFTNNGVFNMHTHHNLAHRNQHVMHADDHQHRFAVHFSASIANLKLIGPYLLFAYLIGVIYVDFLQGVFPQLLKDLPLATLRDKRIQHDCAPALLTQHVKEC